MCTYYNFFFYNSLITIKIIILFVSYEILKEFYTRQRFNLKSFRTFANNDSSALSLRRSPARPTINTVYTNVSFCISFLAPSSFSCVCLPWKVIHRAQNSLAHISTRGVSFKYSRTLRPPFNVRQPVTIMAGQPLVGAGKRSTFQKAFAPRRSSAVIHRIPFSLSSTQSPLCTSLLSVSLENSRLYILRR